MSDFDPEQAKQRLRELDDLRNRQIDENPFLLHKLRRGDYDFHVDADWDIRELQKDAEALHLSPDDSRRVGAVYGMGARGVRAA
jgi:hypothetical protein